MTKSTLISEFKNIFKKDPSVYVKAPGRANLIGEHTDYNDGFVFPAAIDRYVEVAAAPSKSQVVRLYSTLYKEMVEFSVSDIQGAGNGHWSNYQKGVASILLQNGFGISGADMIISGNVPLGAGLSSSAAVEVAAVYVFKNLCGLDIDPVQAAKLGQKAENEFVGMNCGIMDQFASAMGRKNHAVFLDCRSLDYKYSPLGTEEWKIVLINSKVSHKLTESAYNTRRNESFKGVEILSQYLPGITHLRDVESEHYNKYKSFLPEVIKKRCSHVIEENERVVRGVKLLEDGDIPGFGRLMNASHASLRDLYEVSSPELDLLADLAQKINGVAGSRIMGGGFGGCTINLVKNDIIPFLSAGILTPYEKETRLKPEMYVCNIVNGAEIFNIS